MPGDGEPVKAGHALLLRAANVREVVFGPLPGQGDFGRASFRGRVETSRGLARRATGR